MTRLCRFRPLSADYKLKTYLRITRLYLEDDDPVQAEVFINRASLLQNDTRDEQLQILYRVKGRGRVFPFDVFI